MNYLEYSDATHRYFADGKELPSVTQILDLAGQISAYCRDEEARYRGTKVHEYCAIDDVAPLDLRTVPREFRRYLKAWRKFRQDTGFRPSLIEARVDCLEYGYSGRLDRFGLFDTSTFPTILDIKTSKTGAIPDYGRLQTVAYGFALKPTSVFGRIVVSLKPDGNYNTKPYPITTYTADRAEWLSLVQKHKEQINVRTNDAHAG